MREYLDLERRHMKNEEEVVFPLARHCLTDEDWKEIDNAFAKNALSLFTDNLAIGFQGLRHRINEMLKMAHPPA